MRFIDRAAQAARFVAAGAVNTVATYVLYVLALHFMDYRWAYTLSYAAGIALSFVLNGAWVFQSGLSLRAALLFPLVYIAQYLLGLVIVTVLVDRAGVPAAIAPLLAVAFTIPVTFMLARYIFRIPARTPEGPQT